MRPERINFENEKDTAEAGKTKINPDEDSYIKVRSEVM